MSYSERIRNYRLNRRQFLIGATLAGSALALQAAFSENPLERREGLQPLYNVANFDFTSEDGNPYTLSYDYFETLDQVKELVGPEYNVPPWLLATYAPRLLVENMEDIMKHEIATQYPEYGIVAGGMLSFTSHGWRVAQVQKKFARRFGYEVLPQVYPVQAGITIKDLHHKDSLGNPSVLLHMSADPIKAQLRQLPDLNIVNISLQFGELAITHKRKKVTSEINKNMYQSLQHTLLTSYKAPSWPEYLFYNPDEYYIDETSDTPQLKSRASDEAVPIDSTDVNIVPEQEYQIFTDQREREILQETIQIEEVDTSKNPYYEITGAFRDIETGKENIQELFSLVNEFPDKLFFVAAGNYGDDLDPLREQYAEIWPENLIIAGHWDSKAKYPRMYGVYDIFGADIYFDARTIGGDNGSSFATATLSSAASILEEKGLSIYEIKEFLFECCDIVEIEKIPMVPLGSMNIEDYINAHMNTSMEAVRVFNIAKFKNQLRNL